MTVTLRLMFLTTLLPLRGQITEYPVSFNGLGGIAAGPDGALWYTNFLGQIARMTTAGVVTSEVATPTNTAEAI